MPGLSWEIMTGLACMLCSKSSLLWHQCQVEAGWHLSWQSRSSMLGAGASAPDRALSAGDVCARAEAGGWGDWVLPGLRCGVRDALACPDRAPRALSSSLASSAASRSACTQHTPQLGVHAILPVMLLQV